jgi:hypothetical protein
VGEKGEGSGLARRRDRLNVLGVQQRGRRNRGKTLGVMGAATAEPLRALDVAHH